ncbi:ABC transporter ATP-binding protein, partial [Sulfolobus sp. E5]
MSQRSELLVRMVNIHKRFGGLHAVRGVDLEIYKGEILGLAGDNGAGKSTLMKILAGYYRPDEGEMYFEGNRVSFNSPREAREYGIEMMYQDLSLINVLDITRNFFLGREITGKFGFLNLRKMKEEARRAIEEVGLRVRN